MSDHEIDPETGLPIGVRVDATPARRPAAVVIEGRSARLEPLGRRHARELFEASSGPGAAARFRYLWDDPPGDVTEVERWIAGAGHGGERVGWAVVERATGTAAGRFFLMRIAPEHRRIELGNVLFGPRLARTPAATEAVFLLARHAFEELGYRRFEWKCDALNAPSRRAALRYGFVFEGVFRRDMIIRGRTRDTAWYALTDADWPQVRAAFERWLDPANFDAAGRQRQGLAELRIGASSSACRAPGSESD
jgi:RimJ/RimL family protein N-acetyltransferase